MRANKIARVLTVEQRAYDRVPVECPHCHRPFLKVDGPVISCHGGFTGCGWTGFLVTPGLIAGPPTGQRGRTRGPYAGGEVSEKVADHVEP